MGHSRTPTQNTAGDGFPADPIDGSGSISAAVSSAITRGRELIAQVLRAAAVSAAHVERSAPKRVHAVRTLPFEPGGDTATSACRSVRHRATRLSGRADAGVA